MYPLRKILRKIVKSHGLEGSAALNALQRKWGALMGQAIAAHTFPETVRNNVLTVVVDTPQWMHHLSFYKKEMTEKLKPHDIESIRFRVGTIPAGTASEARTEERKLTDDDIRYVERLTDTVRDDALREKLQSLITRGLKKGKRKKDA